LNARRRFLKATTKLAFTYWHLDRATKEAGQTGSLPEVTRYRTQIRNLQAAI